ncbi:hypothetical protein IHN32_04185 [Deinococcus sp. 14RED07]|uniref:hypothetical protein n=1 Tax=unclassified Deinococcus TaxID=2623546 RepID=UPI001E636020|nr:MULTISPECIES: hypothetical protein [unclassified Deinococcus]MCD0158652.1 hypothetical protein [Deinococcus sp. 6GRE01]MCD0164480.1 hypothetical protein [Deinococcus sp. 12RED42]MCD0175149.1 hypothetical protein [Deinococcus sp. 14RED07]
MTLLQATFFLDLPTTADEVREAASEAQGLAGVMLVDLKTDIEPGAEGMHLVQATLLCAPPEAYTWLTHLLIALEGEDGRAELITVGIDGLEFQSRALQE